MTSLVPTPSKCKGWDSFRGKGILETGGAPLATSIVQPAYRVVTPRIISRMITLPRRALRRRLAPYAWRSHGRCHRRCEWKSNKSARRTMGREAHFQLVNIAHLPIRNNFEQSPSWAGFLLVIVWLPEVGTPICWMASSSLAALVIANSLTVCGTVELCCSGLVAGD
jgi:hypothetical protein